MKKRSFVNLSRATICASLLFLSKLAAFAQYSIVINGPADICGVNNTFLSLTPAGGTAFNWHKYNIPFGGTFSTTNTLQSPETGYWVCDVTTGSGIITTPPVLIRTNQVYIQSILGNSNCTGSLTLQENASSVANLAIFSSYQWKKNGQNVTNSGPFGYNYTATSSGVYTCQVPLNCGTGTSNPLSITIEAPIPTSSIISASGPTTFCTGMNVSLYAPGAPASSWTYQWKKNNVIILGAIGLTYTATQSGSYTCLITNSCGSFTPPAIVITVTPAPVASVITASGPTTFCMGGNVTLSGNTTGGQWSNAMTTTPSILVNLISGDYYVTTMNMCGIATSNHIQVTVNPQPVAAISGLASAYNCMDVPVTLTGSPAGGIFSGVGISGNTFNPNVVATAGGSSISYDYTAAPNCTSSILLPVQVTSTYNCVIPQNVSVSQIAKKTAVISWNGSAAPSFKVRYRKTGSTTYLYKNITWTPCNATSVQLTGLISNTNYTVDVKTVCTTGSNTYSSPITFRTLITNPIVPISGSRQAEDEIYSDLEENNLAVFPNPFENSLELNTTELAANSTLTIRDIAGRIVFETSITKQQDQLKINTSDWIQGVYFLSVNDQFFKLIKQ